MEQSKSNEQQSKISSVCLGTIPPDTVVRNGMVFNAFTGEFIPHQSVWIKDGFIAYAGPNTDCSRDDHTVIIDADGMVLLPGLIDAHTHILSRSGVEEFIRYLIPTGVTTFISEAIELATIVGRDGIDYFVQALDRQPIRALYTVPPLCGLTESQEVNALNAEQLQDYLMRPECMGLGEVYWANLFLPGNQGKRVRNLVTAAIRQGKQVEGHAAGARGRKLQAYRSLGVSSCHEAITEEEVLERLRLGFWTLIRQGAIRKELAAVQGIFQRDVDLRRLVLTTDGLDPEGFLTEGYLDAAVREALRSGAPPEKLYQMVTINVAERFRLDHIIGSLSPGTQADLVMIPAAKDYSPQLIMCRGTTIFADDAPCVLPRSASIPESLFDTVTPGDYSFPSVPRTGKVRAMEQVTRLVAQETIVDLDDPAQRADTLLILALERRGRGKAFMGFLKGFGLQRGACGSTMCWDSVDLIVAGNDIRSMETVITRLAAIGGGGAYAIEDQLVAEFPAPLCGVVSPAPMERIRDEIRNLEAALHAKGVPWEKPLLTLDVMGCAAIPHLRITHEGYVRLKDRAVLSWNI